MMIEPILQIDEVCSTVSDGKFMLSFELKSPKYHLDVIYSRYKKSDGEMLRYSKLVFRGKSSYVRFFK